MLVIRKVKSRFLLAGSFVVLRGKAWETGHTPFMSAPAPDHRARTFRISLCKLISVYNLEGEVLVKCPLSLHTWFGGKNILRLNLRGR